MAEKTPITLDDFLSGATLPEVLVPIVRNSALIGQREALIREYDDMPDTNRRNDPRTAVGRQIAELDQQIKDETLNFRVRAARPDWLSDDANTEEKLTEDGYALAFMAECIVEPKVTPEQAAQLRVAMGQGQWVALTEAAVNVTYKVAERTPFSLPTSERTS